MQDDIVIIIISRLRELCLITKHILLRLGNIRQELTDVQGIGEININLIGRKLCHRICALVIYQCRIKFLLDERRRAIQRHKIAIANRSFTYYDGVIALKGILCQNLQLLRIYVSVSCDNIGPLTAHDPVMRFIYLIHRRCYR